MNSALSKGFRQLQQRRGSRPVVVCAVPNLAKCFTIVIVMRAEDDGFALQRGIPAFHQAEHVVGSATSLLPNDDTHLGVRVGQDHGGRFERVIDPGLQFGRFLARGREQLHGERVTD